MQFIDIFLYVMMFIMGSFFGSFFSLAIYRIPKKQDIMVTRSYCPNCNHNLGFFDCFPILSFIFSGGKCRYCSDRISPRYILLEIFNGVIFCAFLYICYYLLELVYLLPIVVIIYAIAFVLIGSSIMKKKHKYNNDGKSQVKNVEKKINNNIKKSGAINMEVAIGVVLFAIYLVTIMSIINNYDKRVQNLKIETEAMQIAVDEMERVLEFNYDNMPISNNKEINDKIGTFSVSSNVVKYSDEVPLQKDMTITKDVIKIIEVKVKYTINGNPAEYVIKTLKTKGGNTL